MGIHNRVIIPHKPIKTVADVSELIEKEIKETIEEVERLAFRCSSEDDKQRTYLIAKKDVLFSLLTAIQ